MGNCLVTKLKDVVSNDSLPKLGEIVLTSTRVENPGIIYNKIAISGYFEYLEIIGDGYFMLEDPGSGHWDDGTNSIGKKITGGTSGNNMYYCSNGNYIIKFSNKYQGSYITFEIGRALSYNINELNFKIKDIVSVEAGIYSTGSLHDLAKNIPSTKSCGFMLRGCQLFDFSVRDLLEDDVNFNLTTLYLDGSPNIKDKTEETKAELLQKFPNANIVW